MSDKKFQTIIDCGFSKIRAGTFNEEGVNNPFFIESNFYTEIYTMGLNSINKYATSKNTILDIGCSTGYFLDICKNNK